MPRIARRGIESSEHLGRYRWIVERTLAWLARFRRLTIRYERRADLHFAFTNLACALICRLAGELDPATPTGEPVDIAHDAHGGSHLITIGDAAALHHQARATLSAGIDTHDGALPLVVLTHHAPHPDCTAPAQRGTWNAGNSASDLSALTDSGRAALWVHGHVHHSLGLTRPGGTRLLCNPAGAGFANLAFDENRAIALA